MLDYFGSLFDRADKNKSKAIPAGGEELMPDAEVKQEGPSIIAIANQKGGCGKTTTTINLSAGLASMGFKVLVIDLDAQSQASLGIGINADDLKYSIYDVLIRNLELEKAIIGSGIENLDICPASSRLTGAQLELAGQLGREWILRTAINKMLATSDKEYDYIIMDCSPSLNLTTINGLSCAEFVLIPAQTHYFSLEGMKELISTIKIVKLRLNPPLEILGILPTLYDVRTNINRMILGQMRKYFGNKIFSTPIRNNIQLVEAQVHKQSIYDFAPNSNGAMDYLALSKEVAERTCQDWGWQDSQQEANNVENAMEHYEMSGA